ncbi:hypothetical protein M3555_05815 [Caldibacillus thermoamylovorans]|nr:hypothetical protein [Caldibacillus thermoamylovorans]MCM3054180.1 hypothetical protein [Caldibacillus thermoamylovorans]
MFELKRFHKQWSLSMPVEKLNEEGYKTTQGKQFTKVAGIVLASLAPVGQAMEQKSKQGNRALHALFYIKQPMNYPK